MRKHHTLSLWQRSSRTRTPTAQPASSSLVHTNKFMEKYNEIRSLSFDIHHSFYDLQSAPPEENIITQLLQQISADIQSTKTVFFSRKFFLPAKWVMQEKTHQGTKRGKRDNPALKQQLKFPIIKVNIEISYSPVRVPISSIYRRNIKKCGASCCDSKYIEADVK